MVSAKTHPIKFSTNACLWRKYDVIRNCHVAWQHLTSIGSWVTSLDCFPPKTSRSRQGHIHPHPSYKAVAPTWHHQHLFEFADPGVQNSLLFLCFGSPPLLHLLHLPLVVNLVKWHSIISETKTNWGFFNGCSFIQISWFVKALIRGELEILKEIQNTVSQNAVFVLGYDIEQD